MDECSFFILIFIFFVRKIYKSSEIILNIKWFSVYQKIKVLENQTITTTMICKLQTDR